jgi:large subunit ribosomal protein L24
MPKENRAVCPGQHGPAPPAPDPDQEGGIISKEAPIHLSNLALPTRRTASRPASVSAWRAKKVRVAKRSGEVIDG